MKSNLPLIAMARDIWFQKYSLYLQAQHYYYYYTANYYYYTKPQPKVQFELTSNFCFLLDF